MYKKLLVLFAIILLFAPVVSSFCLFGFGDCGSTIFIIDRNVTDQNITQNFGGDLNWTQLNTVVPWQDENVADDITASNYVLNSVFNDSWPVDDNNINFGTGANQVSASDLPVDIISGATYTNLQEYINFQSVGKISGGELTGNGDGTVDVNAGTGMIKTTDSDVGNNVFFDWDGNASVPLTDDALNYVYVDRDVGTGDITLGSTTDSENINNHTRFAVGMAFRKGNVVEVLQDGVLLDDFIAREWHRLEHRGIERMSGSVISETGERYVDVTAGVYYKNSTHVETDAFDSNSADRFFNVYRDGGEDWAFQADQAQFSNSLYDDGDGTPENVGVGKYAVYWVYQCLEGDIYIQFAQVSNYNLAQAQASQPPASPNYLSQFAFLIGKIIILNGGTNAIDVINTSDSTFVPQAVNVHNELSGLQGGIVNEYYHQTGAEYTELSAWLDDVNLNSDGSTELPILSVSGNTDSNSLTLTNIAPADDFKIFYEDANWVIEFEENDGDNMGMIFRSGVEELLRFGLAAGNYSSIAFGIDTLASGNRSFAVGQNSVASGGRSLSTGTSTIAEGDESITGGQFSVANGNASLSMGRYTVTDAFASVAFGRYNVGGGADASWVATQTLFELGMGTSDANRVNAFIVNKKGDTRIAGKLDVNRLCLSGDCINAWVDVNKVGGFYFAGGNMILGDDNKFHVNDANIISENSLLASGDNVSELTNDSGFITTWGVYSAGGNIIIGDDNKIHVNDANIISENDLTTNTILYAATQNIFDGNITNVPAESILAGAFGTGAYTFDNNVYVRAIKTSDPGLKSLGMDIDAWTSATIPVARIRTNANATGRNLLEMWTDFDGTPVKQFEFTDQGKLIALGAVEGTNITATGTTGLQLTGVGGQISFANGATIDEDADGALTILNAYPYVKWDMGTDDGNGLALYLRNLNSAGNDVYMKYHYYSGGHRIWSTGVSADEYVISDGADVHSNQTWKVDGSGNVTQTGTLDSGAIASTGTITALGSTHTFGTADTTQGIINLLSGGAGTSKGPRVYWEVSPDYDAVITSWRFGQDWDSGDFRFWGNDGSDRDAMYFSNDTTPDVTISNNLAVGGTTTSTGAITAEATNIWGTDHQYNVGQGDNIEYFIDTSRLGGANPSTEPIVKFSTVGAEVNFTAVQLNGRVYIQSWTDKPGGYLEYWINIEDSGIVNWSYTKYRAADSFTYELQLREYDTDLYELQIVASNGNRAMITHEAKWMNTGVNATVDFTVLMGTAETTGSLQTPTWKNVNTFDDSGNAFVPTKLGIGVITDLSDDPLARVVRNQTAGTPNYGANVLFAIQDTATTSQGVEMSLTAGVNGPAKINFGDNSNEDAGSLNYLNQTDEFQFITGSINPLAISNTAVTHNQTAIFNDDMTLQNGDVFTRGVFVRSTSISYDDSTESLMTVADGYVIVDVYVRVTVAWDGTTGLFTIGDGNDADGFAALSNATLGTTGYKLLDVGDRGPYLTYENTDDDSPRRYAYTGADTIDAFITEGDSNDGEATIYVVVQKLF